MTRSSSTSIMRLRFCSILFCCFFILFAFRLVAQPDYPIGSWRSYLPFRNGIQVTQSADQLFYATQEAIFSLDKADLSVRFITKTNGLSNVGIQTIKYNIEGETLVVIYDNGIIDLVRDTEIVTLNDIKNFNNIIGRKEVNNIFFANAEEAYLATSFGISRLNIISGLFEFTTFTGIAVEDVVVFDNDIYIATSEGIYHTPTNDPSINIDDFGNWTYLSESVGLPSDYTASVLEVYNEQLYMGINDTLFRLQDERLAFVHAENELSLAFTSAEQMHLVVGYQCGDCRGKVVVLDAAHQVRDVPNSCVDRPQNAIEDENGRFWFGDAFNGVRYANNLEDETCRILSFNSPADNNVQDIAVTDNELWVATGGVSSTFNYLFRQTGFYSLVAGEWTAYNRNNTTALAELFDFYTILTNTATNEVYAGSFLDGLVVFDGTNFTVYDDSNSSLNNAIGDENRTRVSGLALDATGNLWISNHAAERPFSVRTTTGDWQSFSTSRCAGNDANLLEVLVDDNGYKWFTSNTSSVGLLVYDTGVLEDNSDDRCRVFTSTNSALPNNTVKDIVVDQDGDVWVGTSEGVVVFQCGPQVFDNCDATEITTDQDETNLGRLLSGNEVSAVAIDGGNNKWFGTTNSGIFVQSPDGREQLAHFNINNSPLLSNTITDISIRDKTGEVFIGTSEGLMSYRAQATSGGVVNSNNIYAFPNPVRPEYDGDIAITGLAQNADVKITDVNGQLIYETRAQGGQAIWDGNDYNGRRASTGVYLVFSTNNNLNNPDAAVAKILFIH